MRLNGGWDEGSNKAVNMLKHMHLERQAAVIESALDKTMNTGKVRGGYIY